MGFVFLMVISSDFRMGQYWDDHWEDTHQFSLILFTSPEQFFFMHKRYFYNLLF